MINEYNVEFKENLREKPFPEIIYYLYQKKLSGVLNVKKGEEEKGFILKRGKIIFSKTNNREESLGALLLKEGEITKKQLSNALVIMHESGKRLGRILVEMDIITPAKLWESVKKQLKIIFYSIFNWSEGELDFFEGEPSITEAIVLTENTPDLILEGIRNITNYEVFYHYLKDRGIKYLLNDEKYKKRPIVLEPYEEYVAMLINGERSVDEIIEVSDIGEIETLRVLYILKSFNLITSDKNVTMVTPIPLKNSEKEDFIKIIRKFNNIFSYIYHAILREVGPIGERVIEKNIGEVTLYRGDVFSNITLKKTGALDEEELLKSLWTIKRDKRRTVLLKLLDDLLMAETLAVKRVLGKEYEEKIISMIKEIKADNGKF